MDAKEKHKQAQAKYRAANRDSVVEKMRRYRQSAKGKAGTMWRNMLARCGSNKPKNKAYKNIEVRMTRDEWNNWAIPAVQEFMDLHPDKVPSIDRKDKNKHYELGNLRIIDFLENSKLSTARIESAFSKMAELYGSCSCEEKQQVLDEFVSRAKESLGMR